MSPPDAPHSGSTRSELKRGHTLPWQPDIIPEPEVAAEYFQLKRIVAQLYDIALVQP